VAKAAPQRHARQPVKRHRRSWTKPCPLAVVSCSSEYVSRIVLYTTCFQSRQFTMLKQHMYTKGPFHGLPTSGAFSAKPRRDNEKKKTPIQRRSQTHPKICRWTIVTDLSFCLFKRFLDRDVLKCIKAARSFLVREWKAEVITNKKVSNKGICRVRVGSFCRPSVVVCGDICRRSFES
jgi:hypothetical protein